MCKLIRPAQRLNYVLWVVFFFFAVFVAALLRASPRSSAAVSSMSAAAPSSRMLWISSPQLLLYKISFPLLWISYFTSATTNAVAAVVASVFGGVQTSTNRSLTPPTLCSGDSRTAAASGASWCVQACSALNHTLKSEAHLQSCFNLWCRPPSTRWCVGWH